MSELWARIGNWQRVGSRGEGGREGLLTANVWVIKLVEICPAKDTCYTGAVFIVSCHVRFIRRGRVSGSESTYKVPILNKPQTTNLCPRGKFNLHSMGSSKIQSKKFVTTFTTVLAMKKCTIGKHFPSILESQAASTG
jgi:hypothetical protein